MSHHTTFELSSISDSVASRSALSFADLLVLGSEPRFCSVIPGVIFVARRVPELKASPGSLKLYDCRESDFRVETHWTNGLMPLKVAQKIAVVSSALLHTATGTLSSGGVVSVG